ncbi:MAG: hypothetical protein HDQ97_04280 [Lachnospiraceae bacterium]|nr:hypothetical protein [Lachnospiraceae bacterium]
MEQKEIEKRLRQYGASCIRILPEEKERRVKELLQIEPKPRTRGSLWSFILEQVGYLERYCLIWQALWMILFGYIMRYGISHLAWEGSGNEILAFVSLLPPVLVVLTVEEITKIYQKTMLEIEYAAKYSLQSVVMIRMSTLCVFHALILAADIIFQHKHLGSDIGILFVYGFTPMIIMTGILLKIMQHCQGVRLRNAAIGLYILMVIMVVLGNMERLGWYRPVYFRTWCMACAAGILFGIWQFVLLNSKLASYEKIVQ